jgi:hypothetical protein
MSKRTDKEFLSYILEAIPASIIVWWSPIFCS